MTNIDRAAEVLIHWADSLGGLAAIERDYDGDMAGAAEALADATPPLLMPDLPEPSVWVENEVIDRAAALRAVLDLHPKSPGQRWVGFPRADRQEHYCMADQQAWPCDTIRALADGLLMPDPQIIRTVEEQEALDPDTLLMSRKGYIADAVDNIRIPAAVVATADQVRVARKALEEA